MKPIKFPYGLNRIMAGAALAAVLSLTSGCFLVAVGAAGAAGAGTVAYVRGELSVDLNAHVNHVADATERAIDQMQLAKINESRDDLSAAFTVRTADDKKVDIHLTRQSDATTKVQIRVGTFGDEALSRSILDRIKGDL